MTHYLNASTYSGGARQIVVPDRLSGAVMDEAPLDGNPYVRLNGEWVLLSAVTPAVTSGPESTQETRTS